MMKLAIIPVWEETEAEKLRNVSRQHNPAHRTGTQTPAGRQARGAHCTPCTITGITAHVPSRAGSCSMWSRRGVWAAGAAPIPRELLS